jgi:hypothetical protein
MEREEEQLVEEMVKMQMNVIEQSPASCTLIF